MNIDQLMLSVRTTNRLKDAGIVTVEQLALMDRRQLRAIPDFGSKSFAEVGWALADLLSGRLKEQLDALDNLDYGENLGSRAEILRKARAYDRISAIVGASCD